MSRTKKTAKAVYSAYKDSGVAWLGEVPAHWEVVKMKYLFKDYSKKGKPEAELLSVTQSQGVVPRSWVATRMVMPSGNLESFKFIAKGDFAISLRSFEGGLEYCHHDGIISPAYTVLRARRKIEDGYYKYLFKSQTFISELQTSVVGIREGKNISYPQLSYSFMPIPPLPEQRRIADYLDQKCAQIDLAIAQKERMIALLEERQQIVIQRAVSQGLDSGVAMKDSGVAWLGEIPESWELKKLRYVVDSIQTGTTPPTSETKYYGEGVNWYNPKDLNQKTLLTSIKSLTPIAVEDGVVKLFKEDSILIVGIGATAGKTAYLKSEGTFNQQITGFHSGVQYNKFYYYFLSNIADVLLCLANYTTLPILNNEFFKSLPLPLPPLSEQERIAKHLDEVVSKTARAVLDQRKGIKALREYREVLIDEVVRGRMCLGE